MWNNQNNQPQTWGNAQPNVRPVETTMVDRSSLASKVMTFTFFSILAAIAGTWAGVGMGLQFGRGTWILFIVAEIALVIGAMALRNRTPINFVLLYSFATVTGFAISPTIGFLFQYGLGDIVIQALAITAGVTLGLSTYAWTTKRDFSGFAPYLFAALFALLLVGILNMLVFHSPLLQMVYLYAGVALFSFYLIFDVQQVKNHENTVGNAIALSIGIYLDILNIFMFILRLLLASRD